MEKCRRVRQGTRIVHGQPGWPERALLPGGSCLKAHHSAWHSAHSERAQVAPGPISFQITRQPSQQGEQARHHECPA